MFGYRSLGFGSGVAAGGFTPWPTSGVTDGALLLNASNLTTVEIADDDEDPTTEVDFTRGVLRNATQIFGGTNLYNHYNNTGGTGSTNAIASGFHSNLAASGGSSSGQTPLHRNFAIYNGTSSPNGVWWSIYVGEDPSFRITRFTTYLKWWIYSGAVEFWFYGANVEPVNGGSGNDGQTFPATEMTQLWTSGSSGWTSSTNIDSSTFTGATYKYYIFRMKPITGAYDVEPLDLNIYGSYY